MTCMCQLVLRLAPKGGHSQPTSAGPGGTHLLIRHLPQCLLEGCCVGAEALAAGLIRLFEGAVPAVESGSQKGPGSFDTCKMLHCLFIRWQGRYVAALAHLCMHK